MAKSKKSLKLYGKKVRATICLSVSSYNILVAAAKVNGNNHSELIDELIQQKLGDPIRSLETQIREAAKEINRLQDQKKELEELKESELSK